MRSLVTAAAIGLTVTLAPAAGAASPSTVMRPEQVVTVTVAAASDTTGTLEAWALRGDDYTRVRGPIPVYVGKEGVGQASERRARTPAGVFTLTEAFGRAANPGTALPYRRVGLSDWWVSDVRSPYYNELRVCRPGDWCGFRQSKSEHLGAVKAYKYAIVIDYNRSPVIPGAGSGFFMHLSEGRPTAGCISMSQSNVLWLLRWLEPADDPVISIGVGDDAYAVLN